MIIQASIKQDKVKKRSTFAVGSLLSEQDRALAAKEVAKGNVIGVFNRGVNALWIDSKNSAAVKRLQQIKGEQRKDRPLALTIGFETLAGLVDHGSLHSEAQEIVSRNLKKELGSLCFIRIPLKNQSIANFPDSTLSFDENGQAWVQTWDAHGHTPTEKLIKLMIRQNIKYPGVTSMNISGKPEIIDQDQAEYFCRQNNISVYLKDPKSHRDLKGSYTIIALEKDGVKLKREGNIPSWIIEKIVGVKLQSSGAKQPVHPQISFPEQLIEGLPAEGIRRAVLDFLK